MKKISPVPPKSKIKTVAIVGTGLIGGSIGLALKSGRTKYKVIGIGRRWPSLRLAKKMGAVDEITLDMAKGIKKADLVILAAPVATIIRHIRMIAQVITPGTIVTDVGSTKSQIVREAEKVFKNKAFFVGSHPLAGSEKKGVSAARPDIFKKTVSIVTPVKNTNSRALKAVTGFWKKLGADVRVLTPAVHDRIAAGISHLPHMVSVALCQTLTAQHRDYAAAGFKDTTRIAMSDAALWADICFSNSREIKKSLKSFTNKLCRLEKSLSSGNKRSFIKLWEEAGRIRKKCE